MRVGLIGEEGAGWGGGQKIGWNIVTSYMDAPVTVTKRDRELQFIAISPFMKL